MAQRPVRCPAAQGGITGEEFQIGECLAAGGQVVGRGDGLGRGPVAIAQAGAGIVAPRPGPDLGPAQRFGRRGLRQHQLLRQIVPLGLHPPAETVHGKAGIVAGRLRQGEDQRVGAALPRLRGDAGLRQRPRLGADPGQGGLRRLPLALIQQRKDAAVGVVDQRAMGGQEGGFLVRRHFQGRPGAIGLGPCGGGVVS